MPPLAIACATLALSCALAFAVLATRTGKSEPPRGVWLVYVAAAAVILLCLDVIAGWAGVPVVNAIAVTVLLAIACIIVTGTRRALRACGAGDMRLLVHGLAWMGVGFVGAGGMLPVGWVLS